MQKGKKKGAHHNGGKHLENNGKKGAEMGQEGTKRGLLNIKRSRIPEEKKSRNTSRETKKGSKSLYLGRSVTDVGWGRVRRTRGKNCSSHSGASSQGQGLKEPADAASLSEKIGGGD